MISKKKEKSVGIALAIVTTVSLVGLGGVFSGTTSVPTRLESEQTANISESINSIGRVGCSAGDEFDISANVSITVDEVEQTIPNGIGITPGCRFEMFTEDDSGTVRIVSDIDKQFTWTEFFTTWGIIPQDTPGFILLTVAIDGEELLGQEINFDIPIEDGQQIELIYISIPDFSS